MTNESKLSLALAAKEAATVLLQFTESAGFSPDPSTLTLMIDSNGKVASLKKFFRSGKEVKKAIAQLSVDGLQTFKAQVLTIKADTKLIDEDEKAPMCTDAPSAQISTFIDGQAVAIYQWASCHTYKSYDGEALSLVELIKGLSVLAR